MRKIVILGGLLAVFLGGCSSTDAAGHNADDVAFAQQMIPHHRQALDMAKLVPSRSTNPKVADLANRIEKAQDPEIRQMEGRLSAWGAGSGHESMHGDDMAQLEAAKGAEFDRLWLGSMIKHHQGAVEMAQTELAKGSDAGAKDLARKIIDAQQAEITEMQGLLARS